MPFQYYCSTTNRSTRILMCDLRRCMFKLKGGIIETPQWDESHAKNGKLFCGRPTRIHFNTKVTRSNSTFYKKLKRNMSRFKALWVIDLSHCRRSIDLLTNVQTFLNCGGHEMNIWYACLISCLSGKSLIFFIIRHY